MTEPLEASLRPRRFRIPSRIAILGWVALCFIVLLTIPGFRRSHLLDQTLWTDDGLTRLEITAGVYVAWFHEARRCPLYRLAAWTFLYPLITLRIIALIHWHALLLWFKRAPWFAKAARAGDQRGLFRPHRSLARPSDAA